MVEQRDPGDQGRDCQRSGDAPVEADQGEREQPRARGEQRGSKGIEAGELGQLRPGKLGVESLEQEINRVWFESGSSRGLGWAVRVPI